MPALCFAGCGTCALGDDGGQHTQRGGCHLERGTADPGTTPAPGGAVTWNSPATLRRCSTNAGGSTVLRQRQASLDHQERLPLGDRSPAHGV
jgi:hypothetical protein